MEVLCKFYSNLGYLELLENVFDKARTNLELACEIENKYLIPGGFRPSLFLHNNFAACLCRVSTQQKKAEWKKAATHLSRIEGQLDELSGL